MKPFLCLLPFLPLIIICACENDDSDDIDQDDNELQDDDNDDASPISDDDTLLPELEIAELGITLYTEYLYSDDDTYDDRLNEKKNELLSSDTSEDQILVFNGISWSYSYGSKYNDITDFWGSNHDSLWACGLYQQGGDWPSVVHNNHGVWEIEIFKDYPDAEVRGIGGSSDEDIYVVGLFHNLTYLILHYNGLEWSLERTATFGSSFDAVWVSEAGEVFAVGTAGSYNDMNYQPLITHFDGQQWTDTVLPVPDMDCWLTDVWGISADSVYAVGYCYFGEYTHKMPLFIHFDGSTWTNIPTGIDPFAQMTFEHMDGFSDEEVYIAGKTWNHTLKEKGILYLYDGNSLTDLKMPIYNNGGYPYIVGIWVADTGMVFVSGPTPYPGGPLRPRILLYKNQQWSAISAFYNIYNIYGFLK